jgi:non-homologous end joining protein Ku
VLVPVKLYPATQAGGISFRMIHAPSGEPIHRAPKIIVSEEKPGSAAVINIMDVLKKSMQTKGRFGIGERRWQTARRRIVRVAKVKFVDVIYEELKRLMPIGASGRVK